VNATRPAAGSLLPLQQFLAGSLYATLARLQLLGVIDPADELVATQWGKAFPQQKNLGIASNGGLQVVAGRVNRSMGKSVRHETSIAA
jgi:hypothetical protein